MEERDQGIDWRRPVPSGSVGRRDNAVLYEVNMLVRVSPLDLKELAHDDWMQKILAAYYCLVSVSRERKADGKDSSDTKKPEVPTR
jgi:hypothetical protein